MNNRDHDQKYYLSYEDGETHFWVNDDVKSQLSFPIGGIVAFPVGANPSRNSDNWLECNGQSFNTSKYPELYKILGSNKVPNYQGMFLRGYGGNSSGLGIRQNNAMIRLYGGGGPFLFMGREGWQESNGFVKVDCGLNDSMCVHQGSDYYGYIDISGVGEAVRGEEHAEVLIGHAWRGVYWDSNNVAPSANEIRPVNVAVKYWIRSR